MEIKVTTEPEVAIDLAPSRVRQPGSGPHGGVSTGRILYAEDNDDVRELSAALLRKSGYDVVTVADGSVAWEELHLDDFDLLITDNEMPGLTGLELIAKLRREGMTLNVILASGAGGILGGPALEQLRLSARLQKPFSRDELLTAVESALQECGEVEHSFSSANRVFLMRDI